MCWLSKFVAHLILSTGNCRCVETRPWSVVRGPCINRYQEPIHGPRIIDTTVVFVSVQTVRECVHGLCSYNCMSTDHAGTHMLTYCSNRDKNNSIAICNSVWKSRIPCFLFCHLKTDSLSHEVCYAKEQYLSSDLVSLYEAISLRVSDKMENTDYGIFKRNCKWQYSKFWLRWNIPWFRILCFRGVRNHSEHGLLLERAVISYLTETQNTQYGITEYSNAVKTCCTAPRDFSCVLKFHDCVKRSVISSVALCTTETIQMGYPQQLESTWIVSVVYRTTKEATEGFTQSRNFRTQLKPAVQRISLPFEYSMA